MTTAVCFDLDGTLVQLGKPYSDLLNGAFETQLGHTDPAWSAHYNERFFEYFGSVEPGPYQQAMGDVCQRFDLSVDPTTLTEELLEREFTATVIDESTHDTVTTLSDRYSLGVITNGVGRVQREKLTRSGLADLFDSVVVSYDVSVHKPDPRIFEEAMDQLDADRYVMVGDDYDADIVGAQEAGFETVHVRSDDLDSPDDVDPAVVTVDAVCDPDLSDLLSSISRVR